MYEPSKAIDPTVDGQLYNSMEPNPWRSSIKNNKPYWKSQSTLEIDEKNLMMSFGNFGVAT